MFANDLLVVLVVYACMIAGAFRALMKSLWNNSSSLEFLIQLYTVLKKCQNMLTENN